MTSRHLHPVYLAAALALAGAVACSSDTTRPDNDPGGADAGDGADAATDAVVADVSDADRDPSDDAADAVAPPDTRDVDPGDAGPDATDAATDDTADDAGDTDPADAPDAPDDVTDDDTDTDDTGSDAEAPDAVDDTPWVRIGTGWDDLDPFGGYERLDDRGTVRIAEGIQGGFHVWGGFEGRGMAESDVESMWELTTEDGRLIGGGFFVSEMRPFAGNLATAGLTVFLALDLDVATLDGVPHELCVEVTLADGSTATDCATVRPSCCDYL